MYFGISPAPAPIQPDIGWRQPSDEVIRRDGGFTDPRGIWISSAIHFGEIQPDPNWRMPSTEEIRANAGYFDAFGIWISAEIHFRDHTTNALRQEIKATEGQIKEWNRTGIIPENWATDGYLSLIHI